MNREENGATKGNCNSNLNARTAFEPGTTCKETEEDIRSAGHHVNGYEGGETALVSGGSLTGSSLSTPSITRHAFNDISVQLPGSNWEQLLLSHSQMLEEAAIFDVYRCVGKHECDPASSGLQVEFSLTLNNGAVLTLKRTSDALEGHLLVTQQDRLREYTYDNVMNMYNFFLEEECFPVSTFCFSPSSSRMETKAENVAERRLTSRFRLRFRGDWTSILLQRRCEWMLAFCKDVCRHLMLQHRDVRNIYLQQHEATEEGRGEATDSRRNSSFLEDIEGISELEVRFTVCVVSQDCTDLQKKEEDEYRQKLSSCRYGRVWGLYFATYPAEISYDLHYRFPGEHWERILERYTPEMEETALRDMEYALRHHPEDATVLGVGTIFLTVQREAHLLCKFTRWEGYLCDSVGKRLERCRFTEVWKLYRELSSVPQVTVEHAPSLQLHHFFCILDNYFTHDECEGKEEEGGLLLCMNDDDGGGSKSPPPVVLPLVSSSIAQDLSLIELPSPLSSNVVSLLTSLGHQKETAPGKKLPLLSPPTLSQSSSLASLDAQVQEKKNGRKIKGAAEEAQKDIERGKADSSAAPPFFFSISQPEKGLTEKIKSVSLSENRVKRELKMNGNDGDMKNHTSFMSHKKSEKEEVMIEMRRTSQRKGEFVEKPIVGPISEPTPFSLPSPELLSPTALHHQLLIPVLPDSTAVVRLAKGNNNMRKDHDDDSKSCKNSALAIPPPESFPSPYTGSPSSPHCNDGTPENRCHQNHHSFSSDRKELSRYSTSASFVSSSSASFSFHPFFSSPGETVAASCLLSSCPLGRPAVDPEKEWSTRNRPTSYLSHHSIVKRDSNIQPLFPPPPMIDNSIFHFPRNSPHKVPSQTLPLRKLHPEAVVDLKNHADNTINSEERKNKAEGKKEEDKAAKEAKKTTTPGAAPDSGGIRGL